MSSTTRGSLQAHLPGPKTASSFTLISTPTTATGRRSRTPDRGFTPAKLDGERRTRNTPRRPLLPELEPGRHVPVQQPLRYNQGDTIPTKSAARAHRSSDGRGEPEGCGVDKFFLELVLTSPRTPPGRRYPSPDDRLEAGETEQSIHHSLAGSTCYPRATSCWMEKAPGARAMALAHRDRGRRDLHPYKPCTW